MHCVQSSSGVGGSACCRGAHCSPRRTNGAREQTEIQQPAARQNLNLGSSSPIFVTAAAMWSNLWKWNNWGFKKREKTHLSWTQDCVAVHVTGAPKPPLLSLKQRELLSRYSETKLCKSAKEQTERIVYWSQVCWHHRLFFGQDQHNHSFDLQTLGWDESKREEAWSLIYLTFISTKIRHVPAYLSDIVRQMQFTHLELQCWDKSQTYFCLRFIKSPLKWIRNSTAS